MNARLIGRLPDGHLYLRVRGCLNVLLMVVAVMAAAARQVARAVIAATLSCYCYCYFCGLIMFSWQHHQ